jgi:hypothetical protein
VSVGRGRNEGVVPAFAWGREEMLATVASALSEIRSTELRNISWKRVKRHALSVMKWSRRLDRKAGICWGEGALARMRQKCRRASPVQSFLLSGIAGTRHLLYSLATRITRSVAEAVW